MTQHHDQPLGVRLLTWLLAFWAGASLLIIVVLAVGEGPVPLGGRSLPRDEAMARLLTVLTPMALAAAGAALALGLRKPWARTAVFLPFVLFAVGPVFTGAATSVLDLVQGVVLMAPVLAALAWYLYFRPGVADYFQRLRTEEEARRSQGGSGG